MNGTTIFPKVQSFSLLFDKNILKIKKKDFIKK